MSTIDSGDAALGPVVCGVILAPELQPVADAYCRHLALQVTGRAGLDRHAAAALGLEPLVGAAVAVLANSRGREWLMVVEAPRAERRDALSTYGWLSQEVLVEDIDALAADLAHSPFEILRPPANLDVSEHIRACQVRGPAGEILYLTEVKGPVPPFELPRCQATVDHLFIPVLSTPDRDASLAQYERLAGRDGLRFDTRISVVNQALGLPLERRHPVGTLQLAGEALIEIDQIAGASPPPPGLSRGTQAIVFAARGPAPDTALHSDLGPLTGHRLLPVRGIAGEVATLMFRD